MYIRKAKEQDIDQITALEAACFLPAEAAGRERIEKRVKTYPNCFWLGFDDYNVLKCYVAGPVTMEPDLKDEMYADATCHREDGEWQMIFSVCTMPDVRNQGLAAWLLNRVISEAEGAGRKGLVLTCKEQYVEYYSRFGFESEGICDSTHGGATWYQMRLTFNDEYFYSSLFRVSEDPKENIKMLNDMLWGAPM